MTETEYREGLSLLVAAFPQAPMDDTRTKVYWLALRDLDGEAWAAGVLTCLRELKFFPTIAELRDASEPRATLRAARMYDQVLALKRGGGKHDGFPTLERVGETLGQAAMEAYQVAGGPAAFADAYYRGEMTWVRKGFVEEYEVAVKAGTKDVPALPPDPRFTQLASQTAASMGRDYKRLSAGDA